MLIDALELSWIEKRVHDSNLIAVFTTMDLMLFDDVFVWNPAHHEGFINKVTIFLQPITV